MRKISKSTRSYKVWSSVSLQYSSPFLLLPHPSFLTPCYIPPSTFFCLRSSNWLQTHALPASSLSSLRVTDLSHQTWHYIYFLFHSLVLKYPKRTKGTRCQHFSFKINVTATASFYPVLLFFSFVDHRNVVCKSNDSFSHVGNHLSFIPNYRAMLL